MKICSDQEIVAACGSFWDLYRRIKKNDIAGLVGLACSETGFELDHHLWPAHPKSLTQNPGASCGGCWRESVRLSLSSELDGVEPSGLLLYIHQECRFLEASTPEAHSFSQLRRLLSMTCIRRRVEEGSLKLHAWMSTGGGRFLVLDPEWGRFVSPMQVD